MNLTLPVYFVLAHFWATIPASADKPMPAVPPKVVVQVSPEFHANVLKRHFQEIQECRDVSEGEDADDAIDHRLETGDTKLLFNRYYCFPIFIDKDHQI